MSSPHPSSSSDFLESSAHLVAWPGTSKPRSLETLIAKMCVEFVKREAQDVDSAIMFTLEQLAHINQVSRCYIIEFKTGQPVGRQTYEWLAPGLESRMSDYQSIPLSRYAGAMGQLRQGQPLIIDDLALLPSSHELVRDFRDSPTRSVLLVPMLLGEILIGVVGLSANHTCTWQPPTIQLLTIVGEMIAGALDKKRLDEKLAARLRFEKFIAELGVKLIHFDTDHLDQKIESSIGIIGDYLEADRCYLMKADVADDRVYVTHEWTRLGIPAVKERLQQVPIRSNAYVSDALDRGEVVTIPDVEALPPQATGLKNMLNHIGTKASAYFPMMHHGQWIGLLGISYVQAPRSISPDDLALLKLMTQMFVNAYQRKDMEERLRASEQRFRLMLEAITDYGYDWNIVTGDVYYTRRSQHSLRQLRDEFTARIEAWYNSIHPDDFDRVRKAIQEHLDGQTRFYEAEYRMRYSGDDEYRWVLDRGMVVERNSRGQPLRFLGAELDIHDSKLIQDERERLIAELASKNQELEQFTYTVSHDLKSPLITISGYVGVLREDLKTGNPELIDDAISEIYSASCKMRHLLDQLLDLSRVGRVSGTIGPITIQKLIDDALSALDGRLRARSVSVEVGPLPGMIAGDQLRLQEVFQNVLENAVKFCSDNEGRIRIWSTDNGSEITVSVADNGIGIDPAYQEKVFGLFEKLDPQSEGTGIGLALCRRIIDHHQGHIWVESTGQGHGTTFHIRLKSISPSASMLGQTPCTTSS